MRLALLNTFAATCLLAAFAVAAMWVRSYWAEDDGGREGVAWSVGLQSQRGTITLLWIVRAAPGRVGYDFSSGSNPTPTPWFGWKTMQGWAGEIHAVTVPDALVVGMLLLVPGIAARRIARRNRELAVGRCRACGYDLRATPERCPECGTASV